MFLPVNKLLMVDSEFLGSFILTLPLIVLFFARALDGITGGNVSVANAYLADITDEDKRSKNFGKMAVSGNLGFIVGPALAGVLGGTALGETLPVLAALLISLLATLLIFFKLPESKQCILKKNPETGGIRKVFGQEQKECIQIQTDEKITIADVIKLKGVRYILLIYFLVFLGFNFFYIAMPVHAVRALKWQLQDTGIFFSFLGLMMVLVQGPILSRLSKICRDSFLVLIGSLLLGGSFLFFLSEETMLLYAGAAVLSLGNGLMWSSILAILSKSTDEKYQGTLQGIASSSGSVASIIGLVVGGLLYELIGTGIFVISMSIILLVFLMSFKLQFGKYQVA